MFKLSILRKVVTDDELFSSFKVSERFAAVLPEDHASGLSLSTPAELLRSVKKSSSLEGV